MQCLEAAMHHLLLWYLKGTSQTLERTTGNCIQLARVIDLTVSCLIKQVVRLYCTFDLRSSWEKYSVIMLGQALLCWSWTGWGVRTQQWVIPLYPCMAVGRIPVTTLEIYVPARPLGKLHFEGYELLWIGEEARTVFHKHCAKNERHLSQLVGVSDVYKSSMHPFILVRSSQYQIVVFHPLCDG